MSEKFKTSIGGQALIEGIMMRGPEKNAMAVRRANGEIFFEEEENKGKTRPAICKWPIIRGVFGFVDSMVMGYRYLMRSAEIAMEEFEETDKGEGTETAQAAVAEQAEQPAEKTEQPAEKTEQPAEQAEQPKGTLSKTATTAMMVKKVRYIWLGRRSYRALLENSFLG